jgi:hypothetical protein
MSESKHTPGPWDNRSRVTVVRQTSTGEWIAEVGGRTTPEARINACLIAAAPDLLAAAEAALAWIDNNTTRAEYDHTGEPLRAAIAKAKGETT